MRNKLKELITRYPRYVLVILELDSNDINLIYNMSYNEGLNFLDKLSNKEDEINKKPKEEKHMTLYYADF